jgi:hypothetical protein
MSATILKWLIKNLACNWEWSFWSASMNGSDLDDPRRFGSLRTSWGIIPFVLKLWSLLSFKWKAVTSSMPLILRNFACTGIGLSACIPVLQVWVFVAFLLMSLAKGGSFRCIHQNHHRCSAASVSFEKSRLTATRGRIAAMPPKATPPVTYSGHCLCGKVKWDTTQPKDTVEVGMCYCDTCQRSTGAERCLFFPL